MSSSKLTPRAEPDELQSQLLKSLLAARDVPCPVCGYNLRAISSANCPECGASLDLRVGSADLRIGTWLIALLALALPLGFVAVYSAVSLPFILLVGGRSDPVEIVFAIVPLVFTVGYGWLLWRLIHHRRKFWAKPRGAQRRTAVVYVLIGPALLLAGLAFLILAPMLMMM